MIRLPAAVEDELGQVAFAVLCTPGGDWSVLPDWRRDEFRRAAMAAVNRLLDPDRHIYWSTHCLHDHHDDCGQMQHARGDLTDPHCKGCLSRCLCPCHAINEPITEESP